MVVIFEDNLIKSNDIRSIIVDVIAQRLEEYSTSTTSNLFRGTWGQELEIDSKFLSNEMYHAFNACQDGSGPMEFAVGPFKNNDPTAPLTLTALQLSGYFDIIPADQMGNHVHVRTQNITKTFLAFHVFMPALLFLGSAHYNAQRGLRFFRSTIRRWTDDFSEVYRLLYNKKHNMLKSYVSEYDGRRYCAITLNRNRKTVLTIELRFNESHPLQAYLLVRSLFYLVKHAKIDVKNDDPSAITNHMHSTYLKFISEGLTLDTEYEIPPYYEVTLNGEKLTKFTIKDILSKISTNFTELEKSVLEFVVQQPLTSRETVVSLIQRYPAVAQAMLNAVKKVLGNPNVVEYTVENDGKTITLMRYTKHEEKLRALIDTTKVSRDFVVNERARFYYVKELQQTNVIAIDVYLDERNFYIKWVYNVPREVLQEIVRALVSAGRVYVALYNNVSQSYNAGELSELVLNETNRVSEREGLAFSYISRVVKEAIEGRLPSPLYRGAEVYA